MKDVDLFSTFIKNGNFSDEAIDEVKNNLCLNTKQLIRKTFKYLNSEIGIIQNNSFFETIILNSTILLNVLCNNEEFSEEEVIINRKRIKKSREAILANGNKYKNLVFLEAANKLDEIILDKNININDLILLLKKLIDKKEDVNIIKKLLNTNKGVIILDDNKLFDYIFNKAINSIIDNSSDIYYYIALLKIFYSSKIDKIKYLNILNKYSDELNGFANEIYMIIHGVRRGLNEEEISNKYGILTSFTCPEIIIPDKVTKDEFIFSIDGSKTKLRDDALSLKVDGDKYIIGIHIADPTYIIKPNSNENKIALNNFKNLHIPGSNNIRILSNEIEHATTLDKNKYRHAISMYVIMDENANVCDYYIEKNIIKVSENLNYLQSDLLINGYDEIMTPILRKLYELAKLLEKKNPKKTIYWNKKDNGSIDNFNVQNKGDKIISEFMVLYGNLIATFCCNKYVPYVYRTQNNEYISHLVKKLNIDLDETTKRIINSIYLPSKYSSVPRYHNGLNLTIYSHSTDPLRRYPDLYNMFLLHEFYFNDMDSNFDYDKHIELIDYFNQRNIELSLMKSEYVRARKIR